VADDLDPAAVERLDLGAIRERVTWARTDHLAVATGDFYALLAEVERLRDALDRRAAAPTVSAEQVEEVREQVADEIKAASKTLKYDDDEARALRIAARIARGEQL